MSASCLASKTVFYQCRLAVFAEGFGCRMVLEPLYHSLGSFLRKNLFQGLMQEISQCNISVMVQTARHQGAVCKYANLFD